MQERDSSQVEAALAACQPAEAAGADGASMASLEERSHSVALESWMGYRASAEHRPSAGVHGDWICAAGASTLRPHASDAGTAHDISASMLDSAFSADACISSQSSCAAKRITKHAADRLLSSHVHACSSRYCPAICRSSRGKGLGPPSCVQISLP